MSNLTQDTPLSLVCASENMKLLKLLLKTSGIDVNKPSRDGNTPLMIAVQKQWASGIKHLLRTDECDVNKRNTNGDTALHFACDETLTSSEVVQLLLQHDIIDTTVINDYCLTPLTVALRSGN
eukprot:gene26467-33047_t